MAFPGVQGLEILIDYPPDQALHLQPSYGLMLGAIGAVPLLGQSGEVIVIAPTLNQMRRWLKNHLFIERLDR
jgi:hypothetical protein